MRLYTRHAVFSDHPSRRDSSKPSEALLPLPQEVGEYGPPGGNDEEPTAAPVEVRQHVKHSRLVIIEVLFVMKAVGA